MDRLPWVSFCISTYQRPKILQEQLVLLAKQTYTDFEVIVSDNDPAASARTVVEGMGDARFRYFHNDENLGMIRSFNKSIERARTEYVVMVTDDDPIQPDFLSVFHDIYSKHPGYSIYCGFLRKQKQPGELEIIGHNDFMPEILDPDKTSNLLWSSAVANRKDVLDLGAIPEYGSPHLADHVFMALVGSVRGGVIVNKMYSSLSSHDTNFSKKNLHFYVSGCEGFYNTMHQFAQKQEAPARYEKVISKHLGFWFLAVMSSLRKYYTFHSPDKTMLAEVKEVSNKILSFSFMKSHRLLYFLKGMKFRFDRLRWKLGI